jgi:NADPH:quinone reductase
MTRNFLANNGRVIVIGTRGEVTINPRELMGRRASIRAFTLWAITLVEEADIHARALCWPRKRHKIEPRVSHQTPGSRMGKEHPGIPIPAQ